MSRLTYRRLMGLAGILGSVLQIIGSFLPLTIMRDGLNQTTLEADSLWMLLVQIPYGAGFFVFLLAMLISLLTALAGLFNKKWLRFFLGPDLALALLGCLGVGMLALFNVAMDEFSSSLSAYDALVFAGPGLWLTFSGFLLSMICAIVFIMLLQM